MKKHKKIFALLLAILMLGTSATALAWTEGDTAYSIPEQQFQTLQVGDELRVLSSIYIDELEKFTNVKMEVLEGAECAEIKENEQNGDYVGDYAVFVAPGTVKLKVQKERNGVLEEETLDLKVLPRGEMTVVYPTSRVKLGDPLPEFTVVKYENCLYGTNPELKIVGRDEDARSFLMNYFLTSAFGSYTGVYEDRYSDRMMPAIAAYRPGKIEFVSVLNGENIGETHKLTIEEPVIKTNLSDTISTGVSIEVKSSLENTNIPNMKISDIKKYVGYEDTYTIGYRPKIEVLEGAELITRSDADYTNTMKTSEKITFNKSGKVTFKITYEMINPYGDGDNSFEVYSPEKIVTVYVKDEILDYTKKTLPTSSELEQEVKTVTNDAQITIRAEKDFVLESKVLNAIKEGNHALKVEKLGDTGKLLYSWTMSNVSDTTKSWNTKIEMGRENSELANILKDYNDAGQTEIVNFNHSGKLPGTTKVKIFVGGTFKEGKELHFYYFNESAKKFEKIGTTYKVDKEGFLTVALAHCSDYVFTEKELSISNAVPNTGDSENMFLWVGVSMVCCLIAVGAFWDNKKYIR